MRLCCAGPLVQVDPDGPLYEHVRPEEAESIIAALDSPRSQAYQDASERPFFARQMAIVLENSGRIEPERIESYIETGGYRALYHVAA